MNIENNRNLFFACAGLAASGSDGHDHADREVSELVGKIRAAGFPQNAKAWFARARTGQVEVNPYWPRGSCLASACFFVDDAHRFDADAYFAFLENAGGIADPIGQDDFMEWILQLPFFLRLLEEHPAAPALWSDYCRIVENRSPDWRAMLEKAARAARAFFGDDAPEMAFCPNLFTPYSADFVRVGKRIVTISSAPDAETMLHETMHVAVAEYRMEITSFARTYGLGAFADRGRMMEFGYMADESASSAAHAIEECFVRALSTVLSGQNGERPQVHVRYGFDSVPFIASRVGRTRPTYQTLGGFIGDVLDEMKKAAR